MTAFINTPPRYSFSKMDFFTRFKLAIMLYQKLPITYIARKLGVHRSTIYRELKKYSKPDGDYCPYDAHANSQHRLKRRTLLEVESRQTMRNLIVEKLKQGWSPQQIAGQIHRVTKYRAIHPETIYRFIYSKMGQSMKLYRYLRMKKKKRFRRASRKNRPLIPNRVLIHERPEIINNRQEFGHWECDLMMFQRGVKTNLITMRERLSRRFFAIKNESKSCDDVLKNIKAFFHQYGHLPSAVKSITFDNGSEFLRHEEISRFLNGAKTYFCEPYKSYQKGSVENANRLLREYFPRHFDIDTLAQKDINIIVDNINERPMACLGYLAPRWAYIEYMKN